MRFVDRYIFMHLYKTRTAVWCSNAIEIHNGITNFVHGTATCINTILPDSNCEVVKCVVFFFLDMKLWAGQQKRGRNHERKCHIPCISPLLPPHCALTKAKVVFVGHYGIPTCRCWCNRQVRNTLYKEILRV